MELIRIPKVENVKFVDRLNYANPNVGTLYLTPTHVIFVDPTSKKERWILLMHVYSVEKQPITTTGCPLFVKCKNFLHVTFIIPKERDAQDVYLSLNQLSQQLNIKDLYCFYYNTQDEILVKSDGWSYFDIETEFKRFGVPNQSWCMTNINQDYQICNTYPSKLFVPESAPKESLIQSAKFRSKGRLPVLTYLHNNQAAICRCSQPLAGFNSRSLEDEQLLTQIPKCNPNNTKDLYIVDTRPKINAMANRAAGKGYENELFYSGVKFHFFAIENIHVMRASLNKLLDACDVKLSVSYYLSNIESSHWLRHIKSLLETSDFIANSVRDGISVLVHCSDGWDRTAQACSLASIQLDPFYRTIKGFQTLIVKDWLSFGHKFTDRCGHVQGDQRETAPVFTQFLDAVWQMHKQFPTEFEFNEDFLITLHDHVYSCQFGTFIGNCEKERNDLKLSERTYSLWGYLESHQDEFINPFYDPIKPTPKHNDNKLNNNIKTGRINNGNLKTKVEETKKKSDDFDKKQQCNALDNNYSRPKSANDNNSIIDHPLAVTNHPLANTNPFRDTINNNNEYSNKGETECLFGIEPAPLARSNETFLKINTSPQCVKLWRGLYNRHELLVHPRESLSNLLIVEKNTIRTLENQIKFLEGRLNS